MNILDAAETSATELARVTPDFVFRSMPWDKQALHICFPFETGREYKKRILFDNMVGKK